ncbi:Glucagon family neuropeptide [Anabarilius grahami]|uniref:Glucagon family neuropeptide n=1 Tax=Anabarilius grahami TaxID=495550 RepID=A0A3N0YEB0_ANAGA|nr:Glucagon family neuropeptide [Anabarilius grahami]
MARSSKATLALLIYGIMMHYSAYCTPIGMAFPKMRLDNNVFDEDGNSLSDLAFGTDQIAIRSPPSLTDDLYTLYYPPEKRTERHADGLLDRALRDILVQLSARKYLHSLMAVRVGGGSSEEDESEPLSKRHSDGIFTDIYSRYRKQMAVKKYLAAVLGRRLYVSMDAALIVLYEERVWKGGRLLLSTQAHDEGSRCDTNDRPKPTAVQDV